ncbi:pirin family protein [Pontibacter sp. JH31]|uniref:Pirin family protein n=1 Tax=Pontibacter aquaedesilientis TaxID=2766980 RepID=A0ABR7XC32_9BACT|nr:pirin family protein [Pontibacter aquaedesilientis]MBD1395865.1 pirin family protein [Pontibacter aquaedesilientis]
MKGKILAIEALQLPWQTEDPFLLAVHHLDHYPKGNEKMGVEQSELAGRNIGHDFAGQNGYNMYHGKTIPGFPYHPHRGFETITIGKQGFVDHTDSLGGAGRFGAGDLQWMTAGKGIQHSEMFPLLHSDKPNTLEIFQIWINLPSKSKLVEPHYKMLWKESIPKIDEIDDKGKKTTLEVYAGSYKSNLAPQPTPDSWAANPDHGVAIFSVKMEANAQWILPAPANEQVRNTLYFYSGNSIDVEGEKIAVNHLVKVKPGQRLHITNGDKEADLLILQGKPINEPIASRGPFVMNTEEELNQGFAEYRKTQFGGWPWPATEQVFDRAKGRFAKYADGTTEEK